MVAPALIAAAWNMPGTPEYWRELPLESGALIVEFGADDPASSSRRRGRRAGEILAGHELLRPHEFTQRPGAPGRDDWRVREGLFGLVGGLRRPGTALIVEDVCVAPERIAASAPTTCRSCSAATASCPASPATHRPATCTSS